MRRSAQASGEAGERLCAHQRPVNVVMLVPSGAQAALWRGLAPLLPPSKWCLPLSVCDVAGVNHLRQIRSETVTNEHAETEPATGDRIFRTGSDRWKHHRHAPVRRQFDHDRVESGGWDQPSCARRLKALS
jgi:hypothetical protein